MTRDLSNPTVIKEILSRHGFTFSKKLGQNFLIDPTVCPRIAEAGNAREGYGIIEIGAGMGVLTVELSKRADKVVAIEVDHRLIEVLHETLADCHNVKVIEADVLKLDLNKLIEEEFAGLKIAVCSNLPYYITSPILMKLFESRLPIESITALVQKEAGVRLCAPVGTREAGAVTVAASYYSEGKVLFNVSRGCFMPSPNVDSCVVRFDMRKTLPEVKSEDFLFKMVRGMFTQRRKTTLNAICGSLGMDKVIVTNAMNEAGIALNSRPEQLSMDELIALADKLYR
ncbi:MAG: 16S rRNA (adenine(1518)-N(6)/adenine(1519)-N(6))-dimethyltransferase RsmA [Oscillospiraceae bacterium]|nr:16S rRNA (adenine(1518)-N(6)/adenine(1519)-N(6))-dimethyltransferase RsmA [Oscillospiraceae bacterium]